MLFGETYSVTGRVDGIEDVGNIARDRLSRLCVSTFRSKRIELHQSSGQNEGTSGFDQKTCRLFKSQLGYAQYEVSVFMKWKGSEGFQMIGTGYVMYDQVDGHGRMSKVGYFT